MKILPSALKHGITEEEIDELVQSLEYIEITLPQGVRGERYMLVGFIDRFSYPIEVGIEHHFDGNPPIIFHANKAREPYLSVFKEYFHGKKK